MSRYILCIIFPPSILSEIFELSFLLSCAHWSHFNFSCDPQSHIYAIAIHWTTVMEMPQRRTKTKTHAQDAAMKVLMSRLESLWKAKVFFGDFTGHNSGDEPGDSLFSWEGWSKFLSAWRTSMFVLMFSCIISFKDLVFLMVDPLCTDYHNYMAFRNIYEKWKSTVSNSDTALRGTASDLHRAWKYSLWPPSSVTDEPNNLDTVSDLITSHIWTNSRLQKVYWSDY